MPVVIEINHINVIILFLLQDELRWLQFNSVHLHESFLNPHLTAVARAKVDSECLSNNGHGMQAYFLIMRSSSDFKLKFIMGGLLCAEGTQGGMAVG